MNSIQVKKRINKSRVLRAVWLQKGISRIEIAEFLGLDKSTITKLTQELVDHRLIEVMAEGEAGKTGGRKPIQLMVNRSLAVVAGVELQPNLYKIVLNDLEGNIIDKKNHYVRINARNIVDTLLSVYHEIRSMIKPEMGELLGIGIGLSGIINPDTGVIYQSIPLDIKGPMELVKILSGQIDVPVFIENDANCCCMGELVHHKVKALKNFLYILAVFRRGEANEQIDYRGLSVGMGIVFGGQIYHGGNYSAGEFRSIFARHDHFNQFSISDDRMNNIKNDPSIFIEVFLELSKNVALMVNTLNISHIFMGGDLYTENQPKMIEILRDEIQKNWPYPNPVDWQLHFSSLQDYAVSYGAASLLLDRLYSIPKVPEGSLVNFIDKNDLLQRIEKMKA